ATTAAATETAAAATAEAIAAAAITAAATAAEAIAAAAVTAAAAETVTAETATTIAAVTFVTEAVALVPAAAARTALTSIETHALQFFPNLAPCIERTGHRAWVHHPSGAQKSDAPNKRHKANISGGRAVSWSCTGPERVDRVESTAGMSM
ncbi:hypothetical protein, partial [Rhizorhabdus wittichii]|uniref:hypothetical protein n=1 Tax=Rhizorhabdus wittichii TaxID=160791 RepID=UPI00178C49ED